MMNNLLRATFLKYIEGDNDPNDRNRGADMPLPLQCEQENHNKRKETRGERYKLLCSHPETL